MAYRFEVNLTSCINCGICMDLCPVRCLDMTRPSGAGEIGAANQRLSPIPGAEGERAWMMLAPTQVAACVGCQVCAQECPTNAITIVPGATTVKYATRGPVSHLPEADGWQPFDAYTRAVPAEPGETPWGPITLATAAGGSPAPDHAWHVAERKAPWQSWRAWLGERQEDLRAPCQAACPVGTNAGLYVSLIAEGRYAEALRVAAEPNPFPVICGRVCTAPCETVCRRGEFDAPIAIRDLKRFVADQADPAKAERRQLPKPTHQYSERIAIVGAGPTGLSAAYYLARRGYPVTVFDAMPVAGGMMAIGIPSYRLPRPELTRDIDAIRDLGVEIRLNTAIGRDIELDTLRQNYNAVLLAVGAQRSQRLGVSGEELHGVIPATTFLKAFNLAPESDAAQLTGVVAVVGGGSTAMDAARSALRAGAGEVHILYRRTRDEAPAQPEEIEAAIAEGVQFHELAAPTALGGQNGSLTRIACQRMRLGAPDAHGRRQPEAIPDETFTLPVDYVLVAIGEAPDPSFLPEGSRVEVAAWGGLLIDPDTLATGAKGIFAAGDCSYGPKTIIHAAAHGRLAARAIHAYLRSYRLHSVRELPEDEFQTPSTLPASGAITIDLRPTPRATMPTLDEHIPARRPGMAEYALGFSEGQARREASRCLRCDLAYLCPTIHTITTDSTTLTEPANQPTTAETVPAQ